MKKKSKKPIKKTAKKSPQKMVKKTSAKKAATEKKGLVPLGDRVVIRGVNIEEKKTKSGFIIPESVQKERPEIGKVIAVGEGRWNEDGDERVPMTVKVGDTILFSKYGPEEVKYNDETFLIVREDQILAIINN